MMLGSSAIGSVVLGGSSERLLSGYATIGGKVFLQATKKLTIAGKVNLHKVFEVGLGSYGTKDYPLSS